MKLKSVRLKNFSWFKWQKALLRNRLGAIPSPLYQNRSEKVSISLPERAVSLILYTFAQQTVECGLESCLEHWLYFQIIQTQFPPSTSELTLICNSGHSGSSALFCPLQAPPAIPMVHKHFYRQNKKINNFFGKIIFWMWIF